MSSIDDRLFLEEKLSKQFQGKRWVCFSLTIDPHLLVLL